MFKAVLKNPVFISSTGATIEWIEYSAYLYLVPVLSRLFLPNNNPSQAAFIMFCLFFATNLARPLGGFIIGYICDHYGRKTGLIISVAMMTLATTGIGLLPTYQAIGLAAPFLLMTFRFMQGLAVAGEFTSAAMFMIEHRPGNPYLAGSWANWGGNLGIAAGALLTAVVNLPGMPEWGWRIPFLLCSCSAFLVLLMRQNLKESPVFDAQKARRTSLRQILGTILKHHKMACFTVISLASTMGVVTYTANMYWNTFVVSNGYFPASIASSIVSIDAIIQFVLLPVMAILAFKTSPVKVMSYGLVLLLIASTANFYLASLGSLWVSCTGMALMAIGVCAFEAPVFKIIYDLFPSHLRCTAVAGTWGLSQCVISAPSPAVAQWLSNYLPWQGGPLCVWVISALGVLALMYVAYGNKSKVCEA